jgi:hypothetical protein
MEWAYHSPLIKVAKAVEAVAREVPAREAPAGEAGSTPGAVSKPTAEVAAKAKSQSAAWESKDSGAEQRGGTEPQHRDAIERGARLKTVSHGITFEVDCDHSQLPIGCLA